MKTGENGYVVLDSKKGDSIEDLPQNQIDKILAGPSDEYEVGLEMLLKASDPNTLKSILLPRMAVHTDMHHAYDLDVLADACVDLGILIRTEIIAARKNHTKVMAALAEDPDQIARLSATHRPDLAA